MSDPDVLFRSEFLTLYSPWSRSPASLGLELVFLICAGLTLSHAIRALRRGEREPIFVWACTLAYGLMIEILSYNFLDNFTHGQFSVMLYHRKLPLYVAVLYPVFICTGYQLVRGLGLRALPTALFSGLVIVAIDVPFDTSGPDAGWWTWSDKDPVLAARLYGVPVTSYYWHLAFSACLLLLMRGIAPWATSAAAAAARGGAAVLRIGVAAVAVGVGTLLSGVVAFLPFHLLKRLGVPDGLVVAGLCVLAAGVVIRGLLRPRAALRDVRAPDGAILFVPIVYVAFQGAVAIWLRLRGGHADAAGKLALCLGAGAGVLLLCAWRRGPQTACAGVQPQGIMGRP